MNEWGVVLVAVVVLNIITSIINTFVNPNKKKEIDNVRVIQENTDAITNLTGKLTELTTENKRDHDEFYDSISGIKQDVALLRQKHESDVKLLQKDFRKKD